MKKFVIFALIAAMTAGVAFAQTADGISINAWGRGVFVPLEAHSANQTAGETDKDAEGINYAGTGVTWGGSYGGAVRTDFRVNGNAEFVGFQVQVTEGPGIENTNIWAKPFGSDILKLTIGKYEVDNLRGKIATDTGFEDFVAGGINEDSIFNRFRGNGGGANAIITSEPMDGVFIGIEIPGLRDLSGDNSYLMDVYRKIQIGFGYQIPDIGHLRVQWLGGWFGTLDPKEIAKDVAKKKYASPLGTPSFDLAKMNAGGGSLTDATLKTWVDAFDWTDPTTFAAPTGAGSGAATYITGQMQGAIKTIDPARIEAAFALVAVDGLLVDLGFKFWLPLELKDQTKYSKGVDVGLGVTYRMDAFAVAANVVAGFGSYVRAWEDDKNTNGMTLDFNLIPTYDLDAATIGASIGLRSTGVSTDADGKALEGDAKDNTMQFGFGGFVKKDLGSGHIKAGLAYTTAKTTNGKANGSGIFTIPIVLEYAFF